MRYKCWTGGIEAQISFSIGFPGQPFIASSYVCNLKILKTSLNFSWLTFSRRKTTNDCCYRLTYSSLNTVKEMCSWWYRSQFNKCEKVWARVDILCLNFRKSPPNQNIKSSKVATFEICEIFSNYYFSYVRDYKATLAGVNKKSNLKGHLGYKTIFCHKKSLDIKLRNILIWRKNNILF